MQLKPLSPAFLFGILFFLLSSTALAAKAPPLESITIPIGYQLKKSGFEPYAPLQIYTSKKSKHEVFGNYWQQTYNSPSHANEKDFIAAFEQANPKLKRLHEVHGRYYYSLRQKAQPYEINLNYYSNRFAIKMVKVLPYEPILHFATDQPYQYDPKLKSHFKNLPPENPIMPHIDGYQIFRMKYKQFDSHSFRFKADGKSHKKDAEGQYWQINYKLIHNDRRNHRYQVVHNFRDELLKIGAQILREEASNITFEVSLKGQNIIGKLSADSSSVNYQFIAQEAFQQTLQIDPDKIRAELVEKGKITLDGIYFDSAKATLKAESNQAIDAVITLMSKYPDLEIEIQGHTDSQGSDKDNLDLSKRRAAAVRKEIVAAGIDSKRLSSKGVGETDPVADNATPEGRAQNRRVELHRTKGGDSQAVITIDFLKPMPGSSESYHREYKNATAKTQLPQVMAAKLDQKMGHLTRIDYDFLKANGRKDRSISRFEIQKNYESVLRKLGALVGVKDKTRLDFYFADRGDGRPVYGRIMSYDGHYEIFFFLPDQSIQN